MFQTSTASEGHHIIKASPGNLYYLYATIPSSGGYAMIFNSTTVPADGSVTPTIVIPFNTQWPASPVIWSVNYGDYPAYFSQGIVAVFSSTGPFTKTESATAYFIWCID